MTLLDKNKNLQITCSPDNVELHRFTNITIYTTEYILKKLIFLERH